MSKTDKLPSFPDEEAAVTMDEHAWADFVDDCDLETKEVGFQVMTNMFVKANATNTALVAQQHAQGRRNAAGKKHDAAGTREGSAKKVLALRLSKLYGHCVPSLPTVGARTAGADWSEQAS